MRDNLMARHFSLTANSLASFSGMALLMALLYLSSAQAALPRAVGGQEVPSLARCWKR